MVTNAPQAFACGAFVLMSLTFGNIIGEYGSAVGECYVASVNISVIFTDYNVSDVAIVIFEIVNVVGDLNVSAGAKNDRNTANVVASRLNDGIKGVVGDLYCVRGIDLNGVPLTVVGEFALVDGDIIDRQRVLGCHLARAFDSYAGTEGLLISAEMMSCVVK